MIVVEQRAVGDLVVQGAIGDACEHYRGLVRATVIAYADLRALPAAAFSHRLIAQGLGQCHAIAHLARDSARSLGIKPVRVRSDGNHHGWSCPMVRASKGAPDLLWSCTSNERPLVSPRRRRHFRRVRPARRSST
jgi:hypothetical protein